MHPAVTLQGDVVDVSWTYDGAATGVTGPLGKIAEIGLSMGVGGWAGVAAAGIAWAALSTAMASGSAIAWNNGSRMRSMPATATCNC